MVSVILPSRLADESPSLVCQRCSLLSSSKSLFVAEAPKVEADINNSGAESTLISGARGERAHLSSDSNLPCDLGQVVCSPCFLHL